MKKKRTYKPDTKPCRHPDDIRCPGTIRSGERQGERCLLTREGCRFHGRGSKKRVREGKKKDPRTAPLKHGLYAQRSVLGDAVAAYEQLGERLYDQDPLMARALVALEQLDGFVATARKAVERVIDAASADDLEPEAREGLVDQLWAQMKTASGMARAIEGAIGRAESMLKTRQALLKGSDTITLAEAAAAWHRLLREVRRLCEDDRVQRSEIPDRAVDWLMAFAEGEAAKKAS